MFSQFQRLFTKNISSQPPRTVPMGSPLSECSTRVNSPAMSSTSTLVGHLSIGLDDLSFDRIIHRDDDHDVYHVVYDRTGAHCSLKVIRKEYLTIEEHARTLAEQRAAATLSGNPHFVKLLASWHDVNHFFILTEYCPYTLHDLIQAGPINEAQVRLYLAHLVCALDSMADHCMLHRDLKPKNIYFTLDGQPVIGGFETSKIMVPTMVCSRKFKGFDVDPNANRGRFFFPVIYPNVTEVCGTLGYQSPEKAKGQPYVHDDDAYALGVTLFQMVLGRPPFRASDRRRDVPDFRPGDRVSPELKDIIAGLLSTNPAWRITDIRALKRHLYFHDFEWEKVDRRINLPPPTVSAGKTSTAASHGFVSGTSYPPYKDPHPEYHFISAPDLFPLPEEPETSYSKNTKPVETLPTIDTPEPKESPLRRFWRFLWRHKESPEEVRGVSLEVVVSTYASNGKKAKKYLKTMAEEERFLSSVLEV